MDIALIVIGLTIGLGAGAWLALQLRGSGDPALVGPPRAVTEGLPLRGERLAGLERERAESSGALRSVVGELTIANRATQAETAKLASAMRDSRVRGAWGE